MREGKGQKEQKKGGAGVEKSFSSVGLIRTAPRPRSLRSSGGEYAGLGDAQLSWFSHMDQGCSSQGGSVLRSVISEGERVCALAEAGGTGHPREGPSVAHSGDPASFRPLRPFVEIYNIHAVAYCPNSSFF